MNNNSKNNIDENLRNLFQKELPKERRDEWFVRKTMNRLPHKPAPLFSPWVKLAYVLSGVIMLVLWIITAMNIIGGDVGTAAARASDVDVARPDMRGGDTLSEAELIKPDFTFNISVP